MIRSILSGVLAVVIMGCTPQDAPSQTTSRATAADAPPPIKPIIRQIAQAHVQVAFCEAPLTAIDRAEARAPVKRASDMLADALRARAEVYGATPDKARAGVETYMKRIFRGPPDLAGYRARCGRDKGRGLRLLVDAVKAGRLRDLLDRYAAAPDSYDTPVTLPGTRLETYALPFTQNRLAGVILDRFDGCKGIRVTDIALEGKKTSSPEGLPVFARPAITYTETWTATCAGETRSFRITHSRDSEGPVGTYAVR